jgi:peptide-methionine (R)-S-oxide reductase
MGSLTRPTTPSANRKVYAMTDRPLADPATDKIVKSDAEWRAQLTPEQYYVARQHGTERAGTSPLNREKREGMFACVCCGEPLFSSQAKFESGTGWPSFDRPAAKTAVSEHEDGSLFMRRTEVRCARCEAHLGHVFPDGPHETTGLRYCINGVALRFKPGGT